MKTPKESVWLEYQADTPPQSVVKGFGDEENECVATLLNGIPDKGGSARKRDFEMLVRMAFQGGLVAGRQELRKAEQLRDRYREALIRLLVGDHVGTSINVGCGAMKVIEDALSWTDAEVAQFMKEWNEGKHQLSPDDQAALKKAEARLFEQIRRKTH